MPAGADFPTRSRPDELERRAESQMTASHHIDIHRGEFAIEDPWLLPPDTSPISLVRSSDGSRLRLATSVALYYDATRLYVLFEGEDDHIVATNTENDAPLYEEDVVEVFIAPEKKERYFELEVSPTGTVFDAVIDSPDGVRDTMKADVDWECRDLFVAVRYERVIRQQSRENARFSTVLAVPFTSLATATPTPRDSWAANFFRIDRHPRGDEFAAWRPTGRTPPDFHVTSAFGLLRFR